MPNRRIGGASARFGAIRPTLGPRQWVSSGVGAVRRAWRLTVSTHWDVRQAWLTAPTSGAVRLRQEWLTAPTRGAVRRAWLTAPRVAAVSTMGQVESIQGLKQRVSGPLQHSGSAKQCVSHWRRASSRSSTTLQKAR